MPIAGGRHVLSGSGDQTITTGFRPDLVLIFFSNFSTEGTREDLGSLIGMGTVSKSQPGDWIPEPFPVSSMAQAMWYDNLVVSAYNDDLTVYGRSDAHNNAGYALYGFDIGATSFTLQYAVAGGAGNPLYWLAFGEEDEFDVRRAFFRSGVSEQSMPFTPTVGFAVGSGGGGMWDGSGNAGDYTGGGASTSDWFAISTWGIWAADEGVAEPPTTWSDRVLQSTPVFNPNAGNNVFLVGQFLGNNQLYGEGNTFGTAIPVGMFSHYRTDTAYGALEGNPGLGFDTDVGRLSVTAVSRLIGLSGSVVPAAGAGGEVFVPVPIDVQAVIFMARMDNQYLATTPATFNDGIMNGFIAENGFQAVIASVGRAFNTPSMARYQNQDRAWVSSLEAGSAGIHAGTAEIVPGGFKLTTIEDSRTAREISFIALGFPEEAPQFFRVL
jgi:hypothetical protein